MEYIRELNIDPLKVIEIGQRILVRPSKFGEKTYYYSNIQDITGKTIFIAVPSSEGGRPIGLKEGDLIEVAFTKDNKRYGFFSEIIGKKMEPFFMLEIEKPNKIFITELREFFRVPVYLPYTAKLVNEVITEEGHSTFKIPQELSIKEVFFQGYIHDISGGGIFITSTKKLEVGTVFLISFSLGSEDFKDIPCKVVRKQVLDRKKGKEGYGAAFYKIDERIREKIIKFCFARLRELRREGKI